MSVQIIEKDGQPEWAVIPYPIYQHLIADAEMLQDIRDYDAAKKAMENGEELIPSEVTYAILDGENPIKVWRQYRGLTRQQLAHTVGISEHYLSQIEANSQQGDTEVLAAIAEALDLAVDDLIVLEDPILAVSGILSGHALSAEEMEQELYT